jgi:hypothetical protein
MLPVVLVINSDQHNIQPEPVTVYPLNATHNNAHIIK